jgi:hypothetical protein
LACNGQQTTDNGRNKDSAMTTVQPEGEDIRRAVKWISEEQTYNPKKKLSELINEACLKFDLSPMDAEFLFRTLREEK